MIETPKKLQRIAVHGVDFYDTSGDNQLIGNCPFCNRISQRSGRGRFFINQDSLLWDCKMCGESGGYKQFLQLISKRNQENFINDSAAQRALAVNRGLKRKTLRDAGIGFWHGRYTIPVYEGNEFKNLQQFKIDGLIINAAGCRNGLWNSENLQPGKDVWIAEGLWDALALIEMETDADVVAVPGAGVFPAQWTGFFNNKKVFVVYDNDEAGLKGMSKVWHALRGIASKLQFVHWPGRLAEGYDIRDLYLDQSNKALSLLRKYLKDTPPILDADKPPAEEPATPSPPAKVASREKVIRAYRKWFYLPQTEIIDVVFGSIFANRLIGDPLWIFLVGPPSSGKTSMVLPMARCNEIVSLTYVTPAGLVSGYQSKTDPSLIPQLDGKVLIIKDFTVILKGPPNEREAIFSRLRDAFDGSIKIPFGNNVVRSYESKFGIIACVTGIINLFTDTSLGERFLRYNVAHRAKKAGAEELIRRAIDNEADNLDVQAREHLQKVAQQALNREMTYIASVPDWWKDKIVWLSQWVAFMRGSIERDKYVKQEIKYKPSVEVGARLAKQLIKLGKGIAFFQDKRKLDEDVYTIIKHVARSSCPDMREELTRTMYLLSQPANQVKLSQITGWPDATCSIELKDMALLGIAKRQRAAGAKGAWYELTVRLRDLIEKSGVYEEEKKWKAAKNGGGRG